MSHNYFAFSSNLIPLRTINLTQFCEVILSFPREQHERIRSWAYLKTRSNGPLVWERRTVEGTDWLVFQSSLKGKNFILNRRMMIKKMQQ